MAYTVHQAKTHFSRLLREAEAGQEVIVMRGNQPVAKVVPFAPAEQPAKRTLGGFTHLPQADPAIFAPLTDEQMVEYGFGSMLPDAEPHVESKSKDQSAPEQVA